MTNLGRIVFIIYFASPQLDLKLFEGKANV